MGTVTLDRSLFTPERAIALAAASGPTVRLERGPLLVLGYRECRQVLRDPAFGSAAPDGPERITEPSAALGTDLGGDLDFPALSFYRGAGLETNSLLTMDGPDHRLLREWLGGALTGLPLEAMAREIAAIAEQQRDLLLRGDATDAVHAFTEHLPLRVLAMLFGIPNSHLERFRAWSHDVSLLIDAPVLHSAAERERSRAATVNLVGYLRGLVARRTRLPKDDLVSTLVTAPSAPEPDAVVGTLMLLLIAGHETSIGVLGNALIMLSGTGVVRPRDRAERKGFVNELLRLAGPVQYVARTAHADTAVGSGVDTGAGTGIDTGIDTAVPVAAGEQVLAMLAAGNHDPAAFPDPRRIDPVGRRRKPGLGFGVGAHSCIGAGLARMELEACLDPLLDLAERLELGEPAFGRSLFIRSPVGLPVTGVRPTTAARPPIDPRPIDPLS